jgi:DNA (cytosine-5)-methyltransferase 1
MSPLVYGSVCSGIEAATVAWHPLGWRPAFFSEIEAFPRAVLSHHYPAVPLHGDFTTIEAGQYDPIELLVGGTPCQSFSIAGLRGGLGDDRGNLALEYLRLADRLRPQWLVWENVPGVLSSNGGRDFGAILGGLVELGYGFAYRVLDAQHFGVPQRRRRVFVVGYLGDWRPAAAVLFERHSLQGHIAPRRQTRESATEGAQRCSFAIGSHAGAADGDQSNRSHAAGGPVGLNISDELAYSLRAGRNQSGAFGGNNTRGPIDVACALNASGTASGRMDFESETFIVGTLNANGKAAGSATQQDAESGMLITHALTANGFDASEDGTGRGTPLVPVAFSCKDHGADAGSISPTLRSMGFSGSHANAGGQVAVQNHAGVRRLTPRECERLQGFPDDYTAVPYRGKIAADGPRYKALGNSMAVPCMSWIGQRIELVRAILAQHKARAA